MKNAQNPDHASLNTIISRLRDGRYVIPDFQREFEWEPWDIRDLMRSIFLDYYIGNLLLWKGKKANFEGLSCESVYGFEGKGHPEHIVLDGQQRLTAMHYAFFGPKAKLPNRSNRAIFFINVDKFMDEQNQDSAFSYEYWSRRMAKLLSSPEDQYAAHFFPLTLLGSDGWALYDWLKGYQTHWEAKRDVSRDQGLEDTADEADLHASNAQEFGQYVKELIGEYQISYIELDEELAIDKVCDIFTQLNSKGVRLDVFDLMNALLKPKGVQLKQMWRDAQPKLAFVDSPKMNVYILQVMSILLQDYCSPKYLYYMIPGQPKQIRDPDGTRRFVTLVDDESEFEKAWYQAVDFLESAINMLKHPQEFGVITSKYLPYESIVPVFSALLAHIESLPADMKLGARRKLQQWYWASVFLTRYSGSVESTSTRDFLDMSKWMEGKSEVPPLIDEFKTRVPLLDLRSQTRSGTSTYNGIFNLLVIGGARDWITGTVPKHDDLRDHHIVPLSWCTSHAREVNANTILNRTPLSSKTNSEVIRDRLPNTYLPELIAANGEDTVRSILETHYVSASAFDILMRNPFKQSDLDAFLTERQHAIQFAIENLLIKERLDLPPELRVLDQRIEETELAIRRLIVRELDDDAEQLPPHVAVKIEERVAAARKRDPAFDVDHYDHLEGLLEYADMRDLQDLIVSKPLWGRFDSIFGSKDALAVRFNQVAEARNGIRHSRSVSQLARKDADAALTWFGAVLGASV